MRQLVYTSLLLIITLRFTCVEMKICSTIKNSQNILNMTVGTSKAKVTPFLWTLKQKYVSFQNWFKYLSVTCDIDLCLSFSLERLLHYMMSFLGKCSFVSVNLSVYLDNTTKKSILVFIMWLTLILKCKAKPNLTEASLHY